jgi:hypothetical protein
MSQDAQPKPEEETEETPQVYTVQKDLSGWRFSRRDFLATASAAAAAALAGATTGCAPATPAPAATPQPTLSPAEKARACESIVAHKEAIMALTTSPDGKLLASASDKTIKLWALPEGGFVSCLMDLTVNTSDVKGITYKVGTTEYTLPCGAPIPPGAVCVCNCVAGKVPACSCVGDVSGGGSHYWHPD